MNAPATHSPHGANIATRHSAGTHLMHTATRRNVLKQLSGAAAWLGGAPLAMAQSPSRKSNDQELVLAQIVDVSAAHQDVSKDYLIGARAAWQDINRQGGLRGRTVRHLSLEVDGSRSGLQAALQTVRNDGRCVALFGTASHTTAQALGRMLRDERLELAHVAPWMQADADSTDNQTFSIFASGQEQLAHALKNLSTLNVRDVGVVYDSAQQRSLYGPAVERHATALQLKVQHFQGNDLTELGRRLGPDAPAILLFTGGTPELLQFVQGLAKQGRQRYVVAMADVNLQTLLQMGVARQTPVIATQVVPMVTAQLPVVRHYRDVMARLFDEPPTPLSLAGFVAARFAFETLNAMQEPPTRASVLAAFQRQAPQDVGGLRVGAAVANSARYVTQSMLTADGRVVG